MSKFLVTLNRSHTVVTEARSSLGIMLAIADHIPETDRVAVEPFNGDARPMPLGDALAWLKGQVCGN